MANKTIKQAIEDLFLGLGGSSSALADNVDTSDVIDDLESAIKGYVSGIIDDTASSSTKTYSSSKIASLIPEAELPAVTADDNGDVLAVVEGAWNKASLGGGKTIIDISVSESSASIVTADTTGEDIIGMINAGGEVVLRYDAGSSESHDYLYFHLTELYQTTAIFSSVNLYSTLQIKGVAITNEDKTSGFVYESGYLIPQTQ